MSKYAAVQFHRELDGLFERRTSWLRKVVDKGIKTKPKVFNKNRRRKVIKRLKLLATKCLASDLAKREFKATIDKKKQWQCTRNKGWNRTDKRDHFDKWFTKNIPYKNCIYVFWKGRRAEYVGRTLKGKGRPQNHFSEFWFNGTTRIDIYSTSQASQTPKLECLAIHRFEPIQNGQRASIPKWAKKCPVCKIHKMIEAELKNVFALK
jgi:chorismate mutase